ncbi:MAG: glycosyltransferase family 9 protein [Phycisphaerae bacterium]|jgi:ADP-heptose:LPS heptosyltransferase
MRPYDIFRALKIDKQAKRLQEGTLAFLCHIKGQIYRSRLHLTPLSAGERPIRVLIVANMGGIGNCVESTPVATAVRMAHPTAHITFMASKGDLFDNWHIPDLLVKDKQPPAEMKFDYTLVPHWGAAIHPSWIYEKRCGKVVAHKVAFNKWFFRSERRYNMDVARRLGYSGLTPPEYVSIKPTHLIPAGEKLIAIMPCANDSEFWARKRWAHFPALIKLITAQLPDYKILIVGTDKDELAGDYPKDNLLDLRGRLTLAETAYALKQCRLAVGNDCGPAHIADAAGTYTIWLFGMSCIVKNHPQNKYRIFHASPACSPCEHDSMFGDWPRGCNCVSEVSAETVFAEIKRFIKAD